MVDRWQSARRWAHTLFTGAAVVVAGCADQTSSSPLSPRHARLNVAPRFASAVIGGPTIALSRVDAWLIDPGVDSTFQQSTFVEGSATLTFEVAIAGESHDFILDVTGFDANGNEAYHARQTYTLHPGNNDDLPEPELEYTAPDSKVEFLDISPRSMSVDVGGSGSLSVIGYDSHEDEISPIHIGWTSRDPNIATIDANGVVTGVAKGQTYVVARTATDVADSAQIIVQGLAISPERAEKLPRGTQQFTIIAGGDATFTWTVHGVTGGDATFGTITATGFYTAPAEVPDPATFDVCAVRTSPAGSVCASVTINPIPTSGADVVVFNDINSFDETAAQDPNNVQLFKNLVNYTGPGPRSTQTGVLRTCGHAAAYCATDITFQKTVESLGFTMSTNNDDIIPIPVPANVKLLILSLPRVSYTVDEINAMKQFSAEGGRILFIGEYDTFLGQEGLDAENDFFVKMGAVMRNAGSQIDCGIHVVTPEHLRPHQVTTSLTGLTMGCASEVILGPNDYPLYVSEDGAHVLAAVAKVDVTPLDLPDAVRMSPAPRLDSRRALPKVTLNPLGTAGKP